MELTEYITNLLIDFDEMGFAPTTLVPNPEAYAIEWRNKITKAFNELTEENKKLTINMNAYGLTAKNLGEENERLRAELTGANKDKQILFDEIASLEAEAEKAIDIAEGNIRAEIASGGTSCHWCEDKVKADTVRKMHHLIWLEFSDCTEEETVSVGSFRASVDQIAKEMLEGKK